MTNIAFPRPFAIAIDDLGWMNGINNGEEGYGPFRIGVKRKITLDDYKAVVDIAKKTGVRLQGLFILGEMDRENLCAKYPTTTYLREKWDNTANVSNLEYEIIDYVVSESAYLEFGLHGVGHEFWPEDGIRRRAEWYNTVDNHAWPRQEIIHHLECFKGIMAQYGLTKEKGHSFPQSFVPCAYSYYWNPAGEYSLGAILHQYGVMFANTDFTEIPECSPPTEPNAGAFDNGVHVMNRYNYGNLWYQIAKLPEKPIRKQVTDYIETHWPNLLAQDTFLQEEVTNSWVKYYESVEMLPERYCSKNTRQHHSQWAYNKFTKFRMVADNIYEIDNSAMPAEYFNPGFLGNLVLKFKLSKNQHLSSAKLNGENIAGYEEKFGFGYIYLQPLENNVYKLEVEFGKSLISDVIWHNGTSNILSSFKNNSFEVEVYGKQTIELRTNLKPERIISSNLGIEIHSFYSTDTSLFLNVSSKDFQGGNTVFSLI